MTHIYGPNGEYKGSVSDVGPQDYKNAQTLLSFGIIAGVSWWLWNLLSNWQKLEAPFNYIAGYYYYLFIVPLKQIPIIWQSVSHSSITSYPNINLVLAGLSVFTYIFIALPVAAGLVLAVLKALKIDKYWSLLIFGPGLFALLWLITASGLSWLFAK